MPFKDITHLGPHRPSIGYPLIRRKKKYTASHPHRPIPRSTPFPPYPLNVTPQYPSHTPSRPASNPSKPKRPNGGGPRLLASYPFDYPKTTHQHTAVETFEVLCLKGAAQSAAKYRFVLFRTCAALTSGGTMVWCTMCGL